MQKTTHPFDHGGCRFWQPVQADSQPKSSGLVLGRRPLGTILHSSNEPGELSQWLCHDDSTINIVFDIIIIIIIIILLISVLSNFTSCSVVIGQVSLPCIKQLLINVCNWSYFTGWMLLQIPCQIM